MQHAISIFGLGYVGCVTAACLAEAGYKVIGVDLNPDKVSKINEGKSPIIEPGLEKLIGKMVSDGHLRATASCQEAVDATDMAFLCVGTPGDRNGQLQLEALERVCREIGQALGTNLGSTRDGTERQYTVVVRSTVLPGTIEKTVLQALLSGAGKEARKWLHVASNPEFMREGTALQDFSKPPFTLVGCDEPETATLLRSVYRDVDAPFVQTQLRTAEAVKYVSNAYHALKICFANEIGDTCTALDVDPQEVMRIFCLDDKLNISKAYLRPGFAFGGSCLPKDTKALLYAAHHANVGVPLLDAIMPSNQAQITQGIEAVLASGKKRIGVFGLAFKPDTDDLRESPMVALVEALIGKGCDVRIYDRDVAIASLVGANRRYIVEEIPHISNLMCEQVDELVSHAEVLVIGSADLEANLVLQSASPDQVIVDLTRGALKLKADAEDEKKAKAKPGSKAQQAA
jgi:GDP-mannose 6-dehydrogenase